jgi:phosphotransferase system enzyme I (PtsI)
MKATDTGKTQRYEIEGSAVSRGLALGRARVIYPARFEVEPERIAVREVAAELARLSAALDAARGELKHLQHGLRGSLKRELTEFIESHALILEDPDFGDAVADGIRRGRMRASAALKAHRDRLAAAFDAIEDPYLRSRREDLDQVVGRVFAALMRGPGRAPETRRERSEVEILVCESLAPSDLDHWHGMGLLGVALAGGSSYSHAAILARHLRVPMVCGATTALARVRDGDLVLVDGDAGRVVLAPDAFDLARLRAYQRDAAREQRQRARLRSTATRTRDGQAIGLYVNAEHPRDIAAARRLGVAGVGLFRTEFLYLRHTEPPGEEEQFRAYREAVLAMAGRPVTLRTLDLGADKAAGSAIELASEPNPALGLRGVRLSLARPALFETQIRAMLRASAYGPVRILLPMLCGLDEAVAARAVISRCTSELAAAGTAVSETLEVGAMIEVPSAALVSAELARALDFLAVGSNDLMQYTLAADRNNAAVSALYDPLHPGMLRLLALVVENAHRARKPISVCGEIAGDAQFAPLLLTLGFTDLSMHPSAILEVREALLGLSRTAQRRRLGRLLECTSRAEVEALLSKS